MTELDTAAFEAEVAAEGYIVAAKSMEPSMVLGDHDHPFDVRGLVTAGEFTVTIDGDSRRYGPGDQFAVVAGRVHSEVVGPEGVTFLVGRREP